MSEVFAQPHQRSSSNPVPNPETIQKLLDENTQLIALIHEHFNKGRMQETLELQKHLHRNLFYLTCLAYPQNQVQQLLPPPEVLAQQQAIQPQQIQIALNPNQISQQFNPYQQQQQQQMIMIQPQQSQVMVQPQTPQQQQPQVLIQQTTPSQPQPVQQLQQQQQFNKA